MTNTVDISAAPASTGSDTPGISASSASVADTPQVARKRRREKRTISNMVAIYCAGHHDKASRTETSHAGEALCPQCKAVDDYCVLRTDRCRSMEHKTNCEECGNHCYARAQREAIREIMRYAGPRMMLHHPAAAVRHLLKK